MERDNPVISVIMPTYRRPTRVLDALASLRTQTGVLTEVIVIDDNGKDHPDQVASEAGVRSQFPDAIYIANQVNLGGAEARNVGVRAARGQYISFLDDDDEYLPGKLQIQADFLDSHPEFDVCTCSYEKRGVIFRRDEVPESIVADILLLDYQPVTPTLMIRRSTLLDVGGFDQRFRRHQDVELLARVLVDHRMAALPDCLVRLGVNEGENRLHGQALEDTKALLLSSLADVLVRLDDRWPGASRRIVSKHWGLVFFDHLARRDLARAAGVFRRNGANWSFHAAVLEALWRNGRQKLNVLVQPISMK